MGVKNIINQIGSKAADGVSKLSALSPEQINHLKESRKKYLSEDSKDDPIESRLLAAGSVEIYKAYLSHIDDIYVPVKRETPFDSARNIRFLNITKWVCDKNENSLEKLVNVYEVLSNEECNISLVFHRTCERTNVYMAVTNIKNDDNNVNSKNFKIRLSEAVKGNFPGSQWLDEKDCGTLPCFDDVEYSVASASNIPAEKSEKFQSQTIEKLLDGIVPDKKSKEYILILLATPVNDIEQRKLRLAQLYSALSPYASWSVEHTYSDMESTGSSANVGINLGVSAGTQSVLKNVVLNSVAPAFGANFGTNFARSSNITATIGKNEGIYRQFTNYNIKHALENLEMQMKRYDQSTALGMWDFAAYVMSEDQNVANNVAHTYLALTQGEDSYMAQTAVNLWRGDMGENSADAKEICGYLKELRHPVFGLNPIIIERDPTFNEYPSVVKATTDLSGKELAYSLNFPQKSVSGLPVIECAQFGRNVVSYNPNNKTESTIPLGHIFHMNHEEKSKVELSAQSLASHTFITGSTGAGKSNAVYKMIDEALEHNIKFMVIEPAKGEYKHVYGNEKDVFVYGTNPYTSPMLKINPFSFPDEIHILEHLDRLIEIFNVCWPMYAAMPAVLKSAVEKSYEDCGWDLTFSTNKYNEKIYPTFADVAQNIKEIIDSSEYDAENKGAYKGSLLTRLKSLTNGINGMIFTCDEISNYDLFDKNTIVDLSRVGSTETKALIMGMLILKLEEYRMSSFAGMNEKIKHITVLEEAHNILRRAPEASAESGNLLGKSVEMLSNAIAQMRTYGEGFIIADQAPGLLDMSVIRNTNTKIIMRLPDETDRQLVGRAANLNDDQIAELAKLPCGVAAVYQNEWIQPVLCKVEKVDTANSQYSYELKKSDEALAKRALASDKALLDLIVNCISEKTLVLLDGYEFLKNVLCSNLSAKVKTNFIEYQKADYSQKPDKLGMLLYDLFNSHDVFEALKNKDVNENEAVDFIINGLNPSIKNLNKAEINVIFAYIINEQHRRDSKYNDFYNRMIEIYTSKGGVL